MAATIDDLKFALDRIEDSVRELLTRIVVSGAQVNVTDLSEITDSIGLAVAGEFRTGQGIPGYGFSGVRMAYPPMLYNNAYWNIAGVQNDFLQFGLSAADGKAYAGGGAVVLDSTGIKLYAGTDYRPEGSINVYDELSGDLGFQIRYKVYGGGSFMEIGNNNVSISSPDNLEINIIGKATVNSQVSIEADSGTNFSKVYVSNTSLSTKAIITAQRGSYVAGINVNADVTGSSVSISGGGATSSDGQVNLGIGTASITGAALSLKGNTIQIESPQLIPDPFTVATLRGVFEVMPFTGVPGSPSGQNIRIHNKLGAPYFRRVSGAGHPMVDPYAPIMRLPFATAYMTPVYNTAGAFVTPEWGNNGDKVLTQTNIGSETFVNQYTVGGYSFPAFIFNGTSAFLSRANANQFIASTSLFAVGCWFYPTTINRINPLLYLGVTTPICSLNMLANNTIEWRVWNATQQIVVNPATTISVNTWNFVSGYWAWYSSSNYLVSLMINGVWTDYAGTAPTSTGRTASGDIRIGRDGGTNYLAGYMHFPHVHYFSNSGKNAAEEHYALLHGLIRSA